MPSSPKDPDPLKDLLNEAETELSRRLREACEAEERGVSNESTAEIRRLEDALLSAAMAAEMAITVRGQIHGRARSEHEHGAATERLDHSTARKPASTDTATDAATHTAAAGTGAGTAPDTGAGAGPPGGAATRATTLREFTDSSGQRWRAWPVVPGLERRTGSDRRFLGEFEDGWICFESLDSTARRRLPSCKERWDDLEPSELERMLGRATNAPERKLRKPGSSTLA